MPEGDGDVSSLFDDMGRDTYITVHRRGEDDPRFVLHGKLSPAEATEEHIAERWGGGTYRCQEKVRNAQGMFVIGRTRTIVIAGAYKRPTDAPIASPAPTVAAPEVGSVTTPDILSAGILQLFQATAAQNQMMMQMFANMAQQQNALISTVTKGTGVDWAAIVPSIMPVVTAFLTKPKDERDPLEMLRTVGEIVRSQTGQQSNVKDLIEAMSGFMELKDMISPSPREPDPLMDSIPGVLNLLAKGQQNAGQGAAPNPVTPRAALPQGTAVTDALPVWHRVLLKEKIRLLTFAGQGKDPEFCAQVAIEFMPSAISGAMREFLADPNHLQHVVNVIPELTQFPDWTTKFFAEARAQLLGDDITEGDEPEPGDEDGVVVMDGDHGDPSQ